ncbi:vesicle transport protein SEC20 isoform X2 [Hypomesus transpacificus]|uniref:vesicle transport protein SEC20 isoform X2 n=1 Tax=Hypomesus transpacificus TaxID=137520 RepID=UPI001F087DAA|nr:vesicle transport protein SEC20 isoform X2 [Hypomesus transpacificus]
MASLDVHVRICGQEIIKYDLEIKALIQDIRECPGPQAVLMDLNAQVKDKFNQLRLRIQNLEEMAKEQDRETDQQAILKETESQHRQMLSNQTAWRKANLACKLSIDMLEKDELLHGGDGNIRQRKATKKSLVQTSSDITESLMSISRMMSQQVEQSEDTIGTLCNTFKTFHLIPDGSGDQRGVQEHDRNHPPGPQAHPQVQPA